MPSDDSKPYDPASSYPAYTPPAYTHDFTNRELAIVAAWTVAIIFFGVPLLAWVLSYAFFALLAIGKLPWKLLSALISIPAGWWARAFAWLLSWVR